MSDIVDRLRAVEGDTTKYHRNPDGPEAAAEIERLRGLDQEASEVEAVIVMRSRHFTGHEPYVGWEGLALALRKDYDELDRLREALQQEQHVTKILQAQADGNTDVLHDEIERLREALRRIVEYCANDGLPNEIVAERVIDRIDEEARQALKESGDE